VNAKTFVGIGLHNIGTVEIPEINLSLPAEAIVEIKQRSKLIRSYDGADTFNLGGMLPGEQFTILIWMKRSLTPEDKIYISEPYGGTVQLKPPLILPMGEFESYRTGYWVLLVLSSVLIFIVLLLVWWIFFRKKPSRSQRREKRTKDNKKPKNPPADKNEQKPQKDPPDSTQNPIPKQEDPS
jgi:hypothetical protein